MLPGGGSTPAVSDIELVAAARVETGIVAVILVGGVLGAGIVVPFVHVPGVLAVAAGAARLMMGLAGMGAAAQHVAQTVRYQQAAGDARRGRKSRAHEAAAGSGRCRLGLRRRRALAPRRATVATAVVRRRRGACADLRHAGAGLLAAPAAPEAIQEATRALAAGRFDAAQLLLQLLDA